MEAINKLREYANLNDDWYVNSQLDLLETEISIAKNEAKIKETLDRAIRFSSLISTYAHFFFKRKTNSGKHSRRTLFIPKRR